MKRNFEGGELLKDIGREGWMKWMKRYWKGGKIKRYLKGGKD